MSKAVGVLLILVIAVWQPAGARTPQKLDGCTFGFREILRNSRLSQRPPERRLRSGGLILDTNIFSALERLQGSAGVGSVQRHTIDFLARLVGTSTADFLNPNLRTVRVYYAEKVIDELGPDRVWRGDSRFFQGSFVLKQNSDRAGLRDRILKKLKELNIGGPKGDADRQIVAEALLADVEPGAIPTFVTGDRGIYERLCEQSPVCAANPRLRNGVRQMSPSFEVTILKRRLIVVPMPMDY